MDNGNPTLGVGDTNQQIYSLDGIYREREKAGSLLLVVALLSPSWHGLFLLCNAHCHAMLPGSQLTLDCNLYKL